MDALVRWIDVIEWKDEWKMNRTDGLEVWIVRGNRRKDGQMTLNIEGYRGLTDD